MATIESPAIVKRLLEARGYDDPLTWMRIYSYTNAMSGKPLFAVFTEAVYDDLATSPYVGEYQLLMEGGKLTPEGGEFLEVNPDEFNTPRN